MSVLELQKKPLSTHTAAFKGIGCASIFFPVRHTQIVYVRTGIQTFYISNVHPPPIDLMIRKRILTRHEVYLLENILLPMFLQIELKTKNTMWNVRKT